MYKIILQFYLLIKVLFEFLACRIRSLPYNMKKKTYCYVGASCTSINCCTEDPEMDTTFNWFIGVDSCHLKFSVGIENRKQQSFLLDFTFGNKKF